MSGAMSFAKFASSPTIVLAANFTVGSDELASASVEMFCSYVLSCTPSSMNVASTFVM